MIKVIGNTICRQHLRLAGNNGRFIRRPPLIDGQNLGENIQTVSGVFDVLGTHNKFVVLDGKRVSLAQLNIQPAEPLLLQRCSNSKEM